jgi:hypothetical protein
MTLVNLTHLNPAPNGLQIARFFHALAHAFTIDARTCDGTQCNPPESL